MPENGRVYPLKEVVDVERYREECVSSVTPAPAPTSQR